MTRGERNNNPGNIRNGVAQWQGAATAQPDAAFVTFTNAFWGIRALSKILLSYQRKYGLWTIREMIERWAPPGENDTAAYIAAVSQEVGVLPDDHLALGADAAHLEKLTRAIIHHENGGVIYQDEVIQSAAEAALGVTT